LFAKESKAATCLKVKVHFYVWSCHNLVWFMQLANWFKWYRIT
jgi:hypothetical protein